MDEVEAKLKILEEAEAFKKDYESSLTPLDKLDLNEPFIYISLGGGELGDLVVTAAKRILGGRWGGIVTVVFDRYENFPAQDVADYSEVLDMMDGKALEERLKKYVKDPKRVKHAIYLEIERADTLKVFELGVREGYNVISTPYGPLIGMDRLCTKLLFKKINTPCVEWSYASSEEELKSIVRDLGFPVIIKPIMTSSGHGTTIAKRWSDVEGAYKHSLKHARGRGDIVVVEKYLEDLKSRGVEVTQLVVRHFDENGRIVSTLPPPIEHQRPGATYHESWLPPTLPNNVKVKCQEYARRVADYIGGLGVYAVEQFVIDGRVYNSEFANRPHDTGIVTRWALSLDEGALHLLSSMGLPISSTDISLKIDGYCVSHVILAPKWGDERLRPVISWDVGRLKSYIMRRKLRGDVWYFGKPSAYPTRRMGVAIGLAEELEEARRVAEEIAHYAEKCIYYG